MPSNFWTNFIIFIIVIHFIGGFGYLIYKLSPRKEDEKVYGDEKNSDN